MIAHAKSKSWLTGGCRLWRFCCGARAGSIFGMETVSNRKIEDRLGVGWSTGINLDTSRWCRKVIYCQLSPKNYGLILNFVLTQIVNFLELFIHCLWNDLVNCRFQIWQASSFFYSNISLISPLLNAARIVFKMLPSEMKSSQQHKISISPAPPNHNQISNISNTNRMLWFSDSPRGR